VQVLEELLGNGMVEPSKVDEERPEPAATAAYGLRA
jgi:hypothetical protein